MFFKFIYYRWKDWFLFKLNYKMFPKNNSTL